MSSRYSSLAALAKLEQRKDARKPQLKKETSLATFKDKTAFSLLQREEQNAKKSRLESLLTQQFIGKYGSKQSNSPINSFIKSTVTDFVYSYASVAIAESMIESLESQIREITASMRQKLQVARKERATEAAQASSSFSSSSSSSSSSSMQAGNGARGRDDPRQREPVPDPSWALLNAVLAQEAEEKERQKAQSAEQAKLKFRVELDKQRASVAQRETQVEAEKASAFEMVKRAKEQYELDQARVREKKERVFVVEREMRLKQIEENKARAEQERQIKILQEKVDMARARRMQEEELELARLKKEEQKRAQDRLVEENEANKAIKSEMVQKQWEAEKRMNKEYELKMLREEQARTDAFQARIDALKRSEKGMAHIAGAKAQAEAFNAQRVMEEVEKKYQNDAARELAKKEQRRMDIEKSREFNLTLIERKQRLRDEDKSKDVAMRKKIEEEFAQAQEKERLRLEEKRLKMNELKSKLDEQVQYQSTSSKRGLSQMEVELNKTIIKKIENDPVLFQKVMDRVKPSPAKPSGGFKWG